MQKEELARKYALNIIDSLPKTPNKNEVISILMDSYIAGYDNVCLSKPVSRPHVNTQVFAEGRTTYKFRLEEVESVGTFDNHSIRIMGEGEEYNGYWVKAHCNTYNSNPCLTVDIFKGNEIHGLEYKGWSLKGYTLNMNWNSGRVYLNLSDKEGNSYRILKGSYYRNGEGWEASVLRGITGFYHIVENYDNAIHAAAVLNMALLPQKPFNAKKNIHESYKRTIEDQIDIIYKAKEYFNLKGKVFGDDLLKQCELAKQYVRESKIIE